MNKIISYNVNGIRAAIRKGLGNWINKAKPDILCLQEIKANVEQFNQELFSNLGYHCFLHQLISQATAVLLFCQKQNRIILVWMWNF